MVDYLKSLTAEEMRLVATFFGMLTAGVIAGLLGKKQGRPTAPARAAAAAAPVCNAVDLGPELRAIHVEIERMHERVIRIEDRTRS